MSQRGQNFPGHRLVATVIFYASPDGTRLPADHPHGLVLCQCGAELEVPRGSTYSQLPYIEGRLLAAHVNEVAER